MSDLDMDDMKARAMDRGGYEVFCDTVTLCQYIEHLERRLDASLHKHDSFQWDVFEALDVQEQTGFMSAALVELHDRLKAEFPS